MKNAMLIIIGLSLIVSMHEGSWYAKKGNLAGVRVIFTMCVTILLIATYIFLRG